MDKKLLDIYSDFLISQNGLASATFEFAGYSGGMEGGYTSQNIQVGGIIVRPQAGIAFTTGGSGVNLGNFYLYGDKLQTLSDTGSTPINLTVGGIRVEMQGNNTGLSVACEINDSSIDGACIGVLTRGYTGPTIPTMLLKAHNSQLKSTLGARLTIAEIDNCRIKDINYAFSPYGEVEASGFVRSAENPATANGTGTYSGITNCAFNTNITALGAATGTNRIFMDAVSYNSFVTRTVASGAYIINRVDHPEGIAPYQQTNTNWNNTTHASLGLQIGELRDRTKVLETDYILNFTVASFVGPVSGEYTITILAATHGKGVNPIINVYETTGSIQDVVFPTIRYNATGDVTIAVANVPDLRFNGRIVIN